MLHGFTDVAPAAQGLYPWLRRVTVLALAIHLLLPFSAARAWTIETIYNFGTDADPNYFPAAGVIRDASGAIYGTLARGGPAGIDCGAVFKVTPKPGEAALLQILHQFRGGPDDGCHSVAELVFDHQGALYGTARAGGHDTRCPRPFRSPRGCGVVFKLTPRPHSQRWAFEIIHKFAGGNMGFHPTSGLVLDGQGGLYGTTSGECKGSTVFKLTPPRSGQSKWTHEILYQGGGVDGPLIFGKDGALYGTDNRCGFPLVFKLDPPIGANSRIWRFHELHRFWDVGISPTGRLTFGDEGELYGITALGGADDIGTAYKLSPPRAGGTPWEHKEIHHFSLRTPQPSDGLIRDNRTGFLYGKTFYGGQRGFGAVFRLAPVAKDSQWQAKVIWSFSNIGPQDYWPASPLTFGESRRELIGTTSSPGGAIFRLTR